MATFYSGMLIASAVASDSGLPGLSKTILRLASGSKPDNRHKAAKRQRLTVRQKSMLLKSVLNDDWLE